MSPQQGTVIVVAIIAVGIWWAKSAKTVTAFLARILVAGLLACLAVQAMSG